MADALIPDAQLAEDLMTLMEHSGVVFPEHSREPIARRIIAKLGIARSLGRCEASMENFDRTLQSAIAATREARS